LIPLSCIAIAQLLQSLATTIVPTVAASRATNSALEVLAVCRLVLSHLVSKVHRTHEEDEQVASAFVLAFSNWACGLLDAFGHLDSDRDASLMLMHALADALQPVQRSACHVKLLSLPVLRALANAAERDTPGFSNLVVDCMLEFAFTTTGARAVCACGSAGSTIRRPPAAESSSTPAPASLLHMLGVRLAERWRAGDDVLRIAARLQCAAPIGCEVLGDTLVREVLHDVWKLSDVDEFAFALACEWNEEPFVRLLRSHMLILESSLSNPHALNLFWSKLQQLSGHSTAGFLRAVLLVSCSWRMHLALTTANWILLL